MNDIRKPRLRWYQFSLRSLCLVMLLACIGMSWVSVKMQKARKQRAAVEAIVRSGGQVGYDWQVDQNKKNKPGVAPTPPAPNWLRDMIGEDFFGTVAGLWYGTNVSDADLEHLSELPQLHVLNLRGTKVGDAGLKHLRGLTQLQALVLRGLNVSDAGLENLEGLTHLRQLLLSDTKVSDVGLEHLRGLTQVKIVWLDGTNVTDGGLELLEGLTQLQYLNLERTKVSDMGLDHLRGLAQLQRVSLGGTKVTDEGVKKLQQALPNCQITR